MPGLQAAKPVVVPELISAEQAGYLIMCASCWGAP